MPTPWTKSLQVTSTSGVKIFHVSGHFPPPQPNMSGENLRVRIIRAGV